MSQEERHGERDGTYSAWHRRNSTRRFVGIEQAQLLGMIDLDASLWVEYDDGDKEPLALIETAEDIGQQYKTATVTTKLAERAHLPAWVLLYRKADGPNPADPRWPDIASFRAKRLCPNAESNWTTYTPDAWAKRLVAIRRKATDILDGVCT